MAPVPKLLTLEETAELLRVEAKSVKRLIGAGILGYYRIGTAYCVAVEQVQDYLKRVRMDPCVRAMKNLTPVALSVTPARPAGAPAWPDPASCSRPSRRLSVTPQDGNGLTSDASRPSKPTRRRPAR